MSRIEYSCIFCDDVRTEISGKHSFIGVYADSLILQDVPNEDSVTAALPRFFIVCFLRNLDKRKKYSLFVEQTGVDKKEYDVPDDAKKQNEKLVFIFEMNNFVVPVSGNLKVSLVSGKDKLLIGDLSLVLNKAKK